MIKLQNIKKVFRTEEEVETWALSEVDLEVKGGEFVAIMGALWMRKVYSSEHPGTPGQSHRRHLHP